MARMEPTLVDPWWKSSVVYQIYPRSFCDSNGDGVGDIRGITSKLDYLAGLGVDVVWLSPVYRSPMDDNGYDISDYRDVDPSFGTLADLDELIAGLHDRGMKLVMDVVINHTSDEHAWFAESRDPASDKRDWYIWRPAREGFEPGTPGAEPTNWGSAFSGSAWQYDEASGEYFLHLFSRKQPDLNWRNDAMRAELYDMLRWWVDRGVDGFRLDVINLIAKPEAFVDGPVAPGSPFSYDLAGNVDPDLLVQYLEELNREVGIDERELFTVGEMPGCDVEQAQQYSSQFHPRLGMVFTFEHMGLDSEGGKFALKTLHLPDLKKNLAHWQEGLAEEGWNSLYWNNHDQPRVVSRFGDDSPKHRVAAAKTLATVLHLHCGTPFVYQGEELGMTNAGLASIDDYRDIETLNHYAEVTGLGADPATVLAGITARGRDNARTPMPWSNEPNHGFTDGTPWLPLNANSDVINVQAELADDDSVLAHYRELIALRRDSEVVRKGRFELLLPDDEKLWVFTRTLTNEVLLVVANMSGQPAGVPVRDLPDLTNARQILGGPGDVQSLMPWEAKVYLLEE